MEKINKKILIVGGAGFIGSHLTKKLISAHDICVFDNLSNPSKIYTPQDGKQAYGDVSNEKEIFNCIKIFKPDILIDLAAFHYIPECIKDTKKTIRVNVDGAMNCLSAMRKICPDCIFIIASSAAVYGSDTVPCNECSLIDPVDIYGESKVLVEKIIKDYSNKFGIKYSIFRLFNVYGYGNNTPHLIPTIIDQVRRNTTISLGNINTKRDYVHVDSVVDAFVKAINDPRASMNEVFNVGTGIGYTALDIVNIVERIIQENNAGYKKKKIVIKKDRVRAVDRQVLVSDISKIRKCLNWKPTLLRTGLKRLIKDEGLI
ncbi:MAG: GDP-mannose 4,6-dehydratase [Candidatus Pacebacteria bacterium]|nr:GDP-mannose 4,6-dehydratase [Candidatus Paceibacterota bacterium]